MQAAIIEIKKELIETDQPIYRVINYKPINEIMSEGADIGQFTTTAENITYVLKSVSNGYEKRNYFVRENDQKIFNDLLAISDGDIKKNFYKGERRGKLYMLNLFIGFLKLPWYKRLFVKKHIKSLKETEREIFYSNK